MEADRRKYQYGKTGTSYIEGNTVRKREEFSNQYTRANFNAVPDRRREDNQHEVPSRQKQIHRQPRQLQGISFASLMVLTIAIAATLYVCVEYLKLQSDVTQMDKKIISLEKEVITMTKENDAAYEQLDTAVDLDYVYRVAVEELGMVYPNNNTVISYQAAGDDYVRQFADIPD
jgi:cell division protein FtsL